MQKSILNLIIIIFALGLNSCAKLPGGDARNNSPDPKKRVAKNIAQGKGFQFGDTVKGLGGVSAFEFASSNGLWRASLDAIDFMPLSSVNYSGGIIITDWYTSEENANESIKISIRFLTNEIRSDALDIKMFNRICGDSLNCKIVKNDNLEIINELRSKILKSATLYKEESEKLKN